MHVLKLCQNKKMNSLPLLPNGSVDIDYVVCKKYGLRHVRFHLVEKRKDGVPTGTWLCNQLKKYPPIMPHPTFKDSNIRFVDHNIEENEHDIMLVLSYLHCDETPSSKIRKIIQS